jgi:regulator of cell morphogenesis and NO signaling
MPVAPALPESAAPLAHDPAALARHLVEHYHTPIRALFPELLALAERVETHHGDLPECPLGLSLVVGDLFNEVIEQFDRTEQVILPLIVAGQRAAAREPARALADAQADVTARFAALGQLTGGFVPPPFACRTWRGLYEGLDRLSRDWNDQQRIGLALVSGIA